MKNTKLIQILNLIIKRITAFKFQSIFIFISITATFVLISTVLSLGLNYYTAFEEEQIKIMGTTAHAGLSHPTEQQYNDIQKLEFIDCVGLVYELGWIQTSDDLYITMAWYDQTEWECFRQPAFDNIVGNYPESELEIMTSTWVLDKLGIKPKIGENIQLTCIQGNSQITKNFTLSGYYDSYLNVRSTNQDYILFSDEFKSTCHVNIKDNAAISIKYNNKTNIQELNNILSQNLHLSEDQVLREVPRYTINEQAKQRNYVAIGILVALFMFTSYTMVYNILFLSFEKSVRFFGILKLTGMTTRELRTCVLGEIFLLCIFAIPFGSLVANIIIVTLTPYALQMLSSSQLHIVPVVKVTLPVNLFASLSTIISVCCSCTKPIQYVSKISPISSSKFTLHESTHSNISSIQGRMYKFAWRNVLRSRKKAISVVISLSLAISSYAIIESLLGSVDSDQYVATHIESDFSIHNPSQSDIEKLNSIDDITNIQTTRILPISVDFDNVVFKRYNEEMHREFSKLPSNYLKENFRGYLIIVDDLAAEYMKNKLNIEFNIDSFLNGSSALIEANEDIFKVGDSVEFCCIGDNVLNKIQIGGILTSPYKYSGQGTAPNIYVSNRYYASLPQEAQNLVYQFDAPVEISDQLLNLMESMFGDTKVTSRLETKREMDEAKKTLSILGTGISSVIFLVGCLNFINTFSVNIIARRSETAMMESVGMTRQQSTRMYVLEGLMYAFISIIVSIATSLLLSKVLYMSFSMQKLYGTQKMPCTELLFSFSVLCIICSTIPFLLSHAEHKNSITSRLNSEDSTL